jgi:hypothetical protein
MKKLILFLLVIATTMTAFSQRIGDLTLYIGNGGDSVQVPANVNNVTRKMYAIDLFKGTAARSVKYTDTTNTVATKWWVTSQGYATSIGSIDTTSISNFFLKARASLATVAITGDYNDLTNKPATYTIGNGIYNNAGVVEWGGNQPLTKSVFIAGSPWDIQFGTSSITAGASINSFRVFTHNGWTLSDSSSSSNPAKIFASFGSMTIQGFGSLLINMAANIQLFNIATNADSTTYKPLEIASSGLIRKGVWYNQSPMTTLGDIPYEDATPKPVRLAGNTTTTKKFLVQTGNGSVSAAPLWDVIIAGDIPTLNQNTTGTASNITGVLGSASMPALTGDVTNSSGSLATTISAHVVTNAKAAQMASHTIKGNNTAGTADAIDLTQAQLTAEVNTFTTTLNGSVPAPGTSNTTDFLRRDGTWAAPAGGGSSYTFQQSIVNNAGTVNLVGDVTTPGNYQYYGTNGSGVRSLYGLPLVPDGAGNFAMGGAFATTRIYFNNNGGTSAYFIQNNAGNFRYDGTAHAFWASNTNVFNISNLGAIGWPLLNGTGTRLLVADLNGTMTRSSVDPALIEPLTTVATGLTAAGTTQGTALVLTGANSLQEVTTAASGTGVVLPTSTTSASVSVINRGANAIIVYPASGATINGQAANTGFTLPANGAITFQGKSTTAWYTDNSFQNGDVNTTDGSAALTIGANKVTNSQLAQMATNTIKGNNTGGTSNALDLTVAQTKTLLAIGESDVSNLTTDLAAKAPINNPTFTGIVTFPTGTTSVAAMDIPAGSLLTTALAGKVENNGYSLFFTPTGTQRGIMPNYQISSIASGTVALSSATGLQSIFASATDAVSLSANTTYRFEGDYFITKGTTTTCTVNTGFTYSGTMATIAYTAFGMSAALDANGTTQGVYVDRLTSTGVTSTGVAANAMIHISGKLVTTTSGTLTPQIAFSAAPGGTNTVNAPTYFEIWPVGVDTNTSIGAWQ